MPDLPQEKQASIERLGSGTFNVVVLFFSTIFWDRQVSTQACGGLLPSRASLPPFTDECRNSRAESLDLPRWAKSREALRLSQPGQVVRVPSAPFHAETHHPSLTRSVPRALQRLRSGIRYPVLVAYQTSQAAETESDVAKADGVVVEEALSFLNTIYKNASKPLKV